MTEYKDDFTLDGRIKPAHPGVTRAKVKEADRLLKMALHGDKMAAGMLAEVHTTSDLKFNMAHLITAVTLPQFDAAERTWSKVAGVRTVPDFGPVRLQSIYGNLTGAGIHENGGLVNVPEGVLYPYTTISGQEAFYAKISKMGAKFGFTWEANVNDVIGFFENIPGELVQAALDTEEREVYDALVSGTTVSLASQVLPNEVTTPVNAPLSPDAIWAAIMQLENTEINGRKIGRATGYNIVVPIGVKDFIEYQLNQKILMIVDGAITYGPGDRSALNNIEVVETSFLTGTNWIVIPKPGAVRRPVLELGRLRGYEAPELRVHGDTGQYVGGSAVSPFEGDFSNDVVSYRIRFVVGGILWSTAFSLKSNGTGS